MTRALVSGGGGPVGVAWQAGLLAGLALGDAVRAAARDQGRAEAERIGAIWS